MDASKEGSTRESGEARNSSKDVGEDGGEETDVAVAAVAAVVLIASAVNGDGKRSTGTRTHNWDCLKQETLPAFIASVKVEMEGNALLCTEEEEEEEAPVVGADGDGGDGTVRPI